MKKLFVLAIFSLLQTGVMAATDTLTVRIDGMRCGECAQKVKNILRKDQGVGTIQFNLERRTATIAYDPSKTCVDSIEARLAASKRYKARSYSKTDFVRRAFGLRIDDMYCKKCSDRIMEAVNKIDGIDSLAAHLDKHYLFIRYDANRTCKDSIRAVIGKLGYTPVNYYTSDKIAFAYYNIPAEAATQETIDNLIILDAVDDVNVNPRKKSMAVTYFCKELSAEDLLKEIEKLGIKAVLPPAHQCKEEK